MPLGEDREGHMDDGRRNEDDDKEEHQKEILSHEEGVEETSQKDEGHRQHSHGEHHQPLGVEDIAFDKHGGQRPEEGYEAKDCKSGGYRGHFCLELKVFS